MPPDRRPQDAWRSAAANAGRPMPGKPHRAKNRARWLLPALLVAGILGLIAGLTIYTGQPPDPVLLAIPITQYANPDWPTNPFAEADARGFRDRFGGDSAQAFQVQEKARILRELNQLADDSREKHKGRPVVVYLCGLGVPTETGAALIPGDGKPEDPASWITLDELLQPLRRTSAPRLLILDLRPAAGPRTAFPMQDLNEALAAQLTRLEQANDLPFFVLSANTPHDGPGKLRPFQRTAFGFALAHAAGGAADNWANSGRKDGRVTVRELALAVRDFTHHASVKLGGPPQVPKLFGQSEDFRLLPVPNDGPAKLPELPEPETLPNWIGEAWQYQDQLVREGLDRRAPRLVAQYSTAALRAESQVLGGLDPSAAKAAFDSIASDVKAVQPKLGPIIIPRLSTARVNADTAAKIKPADIEPGFRKVLDRIRNPEGVKPDELQAAMQEAWAKPPEPEPYAAIASVLFQFLHQLENPTSLQLKQVSTFLKGFKPPPRFPELVLVEMMAQLPPELTKRWPAGTILALLRLTRDAEDATVAASRFGDWLIGPMDPDGTPVSSAGSPLAMADAARRAALVTLTDQEAANTDLKAAAMSLDAVVRQYQAIRQTVRTLEDARLELEETRAVLSDLAARFPEELAADPEVAQSDWNQLVEGVVRLMQALQPPGMPGLPNLEALTRQTDAVRATRLKLLRFRPVPLDANTALLEQVLRWPRWSAAVRAEQLNRLLQTNRSATESALKTWVQNPPVPESGVSQSVQKQSIRSLVRIVDVLKLARVTEALELERGAKKLTTQSSAAEVAALSRKVRTAWTESLPQAFRAAKLEQSSALGWAVHPHDATAIPRAGLGFEPNPERQMDRKRVVGFHRWLGEDRYRADAKALRREGLPDIPTAARDAAATLDLIGRDYQDWLP